MIRFMKFFVVFCGFIIFANTQATAELRIVGSSTIFPIIKDAEKDFEQISGIRIQLRGGGSEVGIDAVLAGEAHMAMVSRDLMPGDNQRLTNFPVAYDGIALIVNGAIPISTITKDKTIAIFSGDITNWRLLGGDDREICVIAKRKGHGTKTLFDKYFGLSKKISPKAFLFDSNNESVAMVASDPTAIGYVSIGAAEYAINLGLPLKLLRLNGAEATSKGVASGAYPLKRTLNLVTIAPPSSEAMTFIRFIQSSRGQQFVVKQHFVPLAEVVN